MVHHKHKHSIKMYTRYKMMLHMVAMLCLSSTNALISRTCCVGSSSTNTYRTLTMMTQSLGYDKALNTKRTPSSKYSVECARNIALQYEGPREKFDPPEWFRNRHVQTIIGGLFRQRTMYYTGIDDAIKLIMNEDIDSTLIEYDERKRYLTPDGDFFDVDWKISRGKPKGTVVLTHGLESGSRKPLSRDLSTAFYLKGFDIAYINFRGCSDESNLTPGAYHLSYTDDLRYFLKLLSSSTLRPIYLSGFSLGANVIANFLIEEGENAFNKYNVQGAALNSCPLDVTKISLNLNGSDWFSTFVYGGDLLRKLKSKSVQQLQQGIDVPCSLEEIRKCKTIRDLEDTVISPIYGFDDALDYYKKSSIGNRLHRICVPLYVLNSSDDPFFVGDTVVENEFINVSYTDYGGHCGNVMHRPSIKLSSDERLQSSWMPNELANFVDYAHKKWESM